MARDGRHERRFLRIGTDADADRSTRHGDLDWGRPRPSAASTDGVLWESSAFTDAVVRAGWSMRLHALLGEQVARAVDQDVLTVAEAEVLLARLAVVIDQAVGASDN